MKQTYQRLPDSELDIMLILWNHKPPMSRSAIEQIINEKMCIRDRNSYRTVKIFLNVSKEKQKERFMERINQPEKNWKFSHSDLKERSLWEEYHRVYQEVINETATKENPGYVIPADQKWYARYLVSEAILRTLRDMDRCV